jgi:hypothetical protein
VKNNERCELALVPASTKIGDLICFLKPHNEPLVLRKLDQSHEGGSECKGSCVNMVGHCLVNGPVFHNPTKREEIIFTCQVWSLVGGLRERPWACGTFEHPLSWQDWEHL